MTRWPRSDSDASLPTQTWEYPRRDEPESQARNSLADLRPSDIAPVAGRFRGPAARRSQRGNNFVTALFLATFIGVGSPARPRRGLPADPGPPAGPGRGATPGPCRLG